jgi:hypothetical protein
MTAAKFRLGCLHMHHSNIAYIDGIVAPDRVEVLHFVDPGLMRRIGSDPSFTRDQAEAQVRRQLDWIASCGLDAILITCTNYIAMLADEPLDLMIPVIKIDEPFFADLLQQPSPHLLLFTNPATVEGTMRRFHEYADRAGHQPSIEIEVMPGTFELVMAGKTEEYAAVVADQLRELVRSGRYEAISVGQLSMAESALRIAAETGVSICNPLDSLRLHLAHELGAATAAN